LRKKERRAKEAKEVGRKLEVEIEEYSSKDNEENIISLSANGIFQRDV